MGPKPAGGRTWRDESVDMWVERNELNGEDYPRSNYEPGGVNSIEKYLKMFAASIQWRVDQGWPREQAEARAAVAAVEADAVTAAAEARTGAAEARAGAAEARAAAAEARAEAAEAQVAAAEAEPRTLASLDKARLRALEKRLRAACERVSTAIEEIDERESACVICMERPKLFAASCGHMCVCEECSELVQECPKCRASVAEGGWQRVYV